MNKELQKLLKQINDKKNEVKSLVNDGKLDKARAAKEELVELQNRFDLLYDLDEDEQDGIENKVKDGTAKQVGGDVKPDKKNIVKSFVNIVKAGFLHKEADEADIKVYKDALTSDTTAGSEGEVGIGVTIPEDIRTDIIELRRSSDNLEQYVNVEGVTTKTGTRNIEVDAESTPFDNVDEAADFPEMDEPEFLPIEYKVKKKGGILKMTAELLEDTASNIMAFSHTESEIQSRLCQRKRGRGKSRGLSKSQNIRNHRKRTRLRFPMRERHSQRFRKRRRQQPQRRRSPSPTGQPRKSLRTIRPRRRLKPKSRHRKRQSRQVLPTL